MPDKELRPWDIWKQNNPEPQVTVRSAKPWDLLNPEIGRATEELAAERLAICEACPKLRKLTKQCKECNCIMPAKVKLPNASCPLGKWSAVTEV